jgi:dethiobiotin synthetase
MLPNNPPSRHPMDTRGLLVTGAHAKCGKTVACAGLAGVLNELGFQAQAIKPLSFQPRLSVRKAYEQAYFDRIVPPNQIVDVFSVESAHVLAPVEYQRLIEACRKRVYPYILETPGSLASAVRHMQDEIIDSIDLAKAIEIPMLLVAAKQPDMIATLAPAFAYAWHRDAPVIGWLAVETAPIETPHWDAEILYLRSHYDIPYLGEIAYSPSISVEALQQGNLLRTTEMGVDLLPIQQALDLLVPF